MGLAIYRIGSFAASARRQTARECAYVVKNPAHYEGHRLGGMARTNTGADTSNVPSVMRGLHLHCPEYITHNYQRYVQ